MKKVKFGIIGCGAISPTYLYTLNKNRCSKIVAVADQNLDAAKNKAEMFNIKKFYCDYKEMISNEKLDAVAICTPHYVHHDQAVYCAEKGLNILCEKPLATRMDDILDMVEKCKGVRFGVMLQRRFYPNSMATRKALQEGYLGTIKDVSLDFRCHKTFEFYNTWRGKKISGGGVLISQALHRIDLLTYFFGKPRYVEGIIKITRPYIEVEDYAKGTVYFENNLVVNIEANNSSGNPETISITKIKGTKGSITLSDDKTLKWDVKGVPKPKDANIKKIPTKYRPLYYGPCHERVIDDFVEAIVNNRQPSVTGEDSLNAMKIIFDFYKSAKEKRKDSI